GDLLAIHQDPLRVLAPEETAGALSRATQSTCPICNQPSAINHQQTVADSGGEIILLCSPAHAAALNDQLIIAEAGTGPGEPVDPVPRDATSWTLGKKRLLFIRVEFSDLRGTPFPDSTGINLITNLSCFYLYMS